MLRAPQSAVHVVTLLEEMPVQETVDAVGRAVRGGLRRGRGHRQPRARATRRRGAARRGPAGPERVEAGPRPTSPPSGSGRPGRRSPDCSPGARPRRAGRPRAGADREVAGQGLATLSLPALPTGVEDGGIAVLADELAATGGALMAAAPAPARRLDVDALLADPRHRDHRVLRLGRRRQDDDRRRPGRARGRGRAARRRPDHRPGPPARPVARPHRARQRAAPGRRGRRRRRRARSTR